MILEQVIAPSIKLIDLSETPLDNNTIENNLSRERVNYIYLKNKSISYNKIWDLQILLNVSSKASSGVLLSIISV